MVAQAALLFYSKEKKKPATLRHGVIIAVDRSNGRAGPVGPFRAAPTTTQRRG